MITTFNIVACIILWNIISAIINKKYKYTVDRFYCGLTGFSGKKKFDKEKIEKLMMWNSLERGRDSTGIYSPVNGLVKTADEAYEFLMKNEIQSDKLFIGHVRASTVGNKTAKNAHPFLEDDVILAHNGTLKNHWALCNKYNLKMADYDVDSHVIGAIIGKEKNFNVIKEIEGAAAFLIANKKTPDFLWVFRNGERPLYRGVLDKDMYISSIRESLLYIGCSNVTEFKEDTIYTIKDGSIVTTQKIKNTPYRYSTSNTHVPFVPIADLDKLWIRSNRSMSSYYNKPVEITLRKYYFVKDTDFKESKVYITDDRNNDVWVDKFCFDVDDAVPKKGHYVEILRDLVITEDKRNKQTDVLIFNEGDIVDVLAYYSSYHTLSLVSTIDNKEYTVGTKWVRRLSKFEEEKHIEKLLLEDTANNTSPTCDTEDKAITLPVQSIIPMFREHEAGVEHITDNFLEEENRGGINTSGSNSLEEEDIDAEEEENEIDDKEYDLAVNSQELTEAFGFLDEVSEALLNYGSKNLPADKVNDFMLLINSMQSKLIDCEEKFCFTAEELAVATDKK